MTPVHDSPPRTGSPADRPEYRLVLCCARTHVDTATRTQVERLLAEAIDWDYVAHLAQVHRVAPLLYQNLATLGAGLLPASMQQDILRQQHSTQAYNIFLGRETVRLLHLFEAHGIRGLSFKGPVLAQTAYGNLASRACFDIDILIPRTDFAAARQVLMDDGYASAHQQGGGLYRFLHLYLTRQDHFTKGSLVFNLDLHTGIIPLRYYYPISFDTFWDRARTVHIAGAEVRSFQPEDMLQILCLQGEKNRWETLKYICDVAEQVRAEPDLDWDVVWRRARRVHGERILCVGLYLAQTLLGVEVPSEMQHRMEADRYVQTVGEHLQARLPHQMELGIAPFKERFHFHLRTQNTLATKLRYLSFALVRKFV